jgi:hypothetical protein
MAGIVAEGSGHRSENTIARIESPYGRLEKLNWLAQNQKNSSPRSFSGYA